MKKIVSFLQELVIAIFILSILTSFPGRIVTKKKRNNIKWEKEVWHMKTNELDVYDRKSVVQPSVLNIIRRNTDLSELPKDRRYKSA